MTFSDPDNDAEISICPDVEELERFVNNDVDPARRSAIESHAATCDSCSTLLADLKENSRLLEEMRRAHESAGDRSHDDLSSISLPGYELLRTIHEGGQGILYEARQLSTNRTVAVKLLLHGRYATKKQRRRFEREIDLAAHLDHPNIVTVFDSGVTEDQRMFLVMRYVNGVPLDRFAIECGLSIPETLALFEKICHAVNDAHQHGVIHRDLKPNNILIDSSGEPHLLDFGLARLSETPTDAERSMQTQPGEFVGTLAYAAPEQVSGETQSIDVRSDVYAIGVMLFETLTGRHPYPIDGRLAEIIQSIAEHEPSRPSSIRSEVDDELDTIVLKLLSKEKDRRYQSVAGLLRDLENYRTGSPIEAKGDSTLYLLRKSLRRHRVPVAAATVVFLVLITAAIVSFGFWQHTQAALDQSEIEASKASAINEFLLNMLSSVNPSKQQKDITVRQALDQAAETIDESFSGQPLTEASVRYTIGTTYHSLGFHDSAEPHLLRALELRQQDPGEDHPHTLATLSALALVYIDAGRYEEAEQLALQSLDLHQRVLGEEDPQTLAALSNLGLLYYRQGRRDEAQPIWEKTLELRRRVLGEEHLDTLLSMSNLGWFYNNQGRHDDAEGLLVAARDIRSRTLGPEHPDTLKSAANVAFLYNNIGLYEDAETILRDVFKVQRHVIGEEHPDTIFTMGCLAWAYSQQVKYEDAEALQVECLAISRRAFGDDHPMTLQAMNDLAILYDRSEQHEKAEPLKIETVEARRSVLGPEHPDTLASMNNLAVFYHGQGRHDEAEELYLETYNVRRRVLGEEHPDTVASLYNIGWLRYSQGRLQESEDICLRAIETYVRTVGPANRKVMNARNFLASMYSEQQRWEDAVQVLLEGYKDLLEGRGAADGGTRYMAHRIASVYSEELNNPEEAARFRKLADPDAD